jgi:hypothetical protein
MVLTFHLVCFGWVLFRSEGGAGQALAMIRRMVQYDATPLSPAVAGPAVLVWVALAYLGVAWLLSAARIELTPGARTKAVLAGLMLAALTLLPGNRNAFIYFQF